MQLLLPFVAGQLARPLIGAWAQRNKTLLGLVDRGSILLVVYAAFSEGVTQGIWHQLGLSDLGRLLVIDAALLAAVLAITTYGSRLLGFSRADEVTIVFCGSKKSLSSGLPMATVLLAGQSVGRDRAAADAVPPDPVDGLRLAGEALRQGAEWMFRRVRWRGQPSPLLS